MKPLPARVRIVEVGPRDGLQNEPAPIATADKIAFIDRLSDAGHTVVEVSAFVSPKWVPQMADAAEVFAGIRRRQGTRYTALVPNLDGLDRAMAARVDEVAIFAAASESFSQRNINQTIAESLATYAAVCARARAAALPIRAYVSTAFGCPFEGDVPAAAVADLSAALVDMGAYEVAISDTIGVAHPAQVPRVLDAVAPRVPLDRIALHFHDTRGMALANVLAALQLRRHHVRCVRRRPGRLPVRARGDGQSRHRGSALHARRLRHRHGRHAGGGARRVALHRAEARPCACVAVRGRGQAADKRASSHALNFVSSQQLTTWSAATPATRAIAMA